VARLNVVRGAMNGLKESKQAVGAATLAQVTNLAPPTVLAQASRLNFSTRLFNLIVTNVPGPQMPLYVLGHELQDLFPVAFLPENHALAIAIMSYNGALDYGLLGDYDALPDIETIAEGLDEALAELLDAARGGGAGGEDARDAAQAGAGGGPRGRGGRRTPSSRSTRGSARGTRGAASAVAAASTGNGGSTVQEGAGATPATNGGPESIIPAASTRPKEGPGADMRAKRTRRSPRKPPGGSEASE
jgi:hypothetical protein